MHPEHFDIDKARRETLGCAQRIHFNNAGASLMPVPVARALHAYLDEEERFGGYETAGREAAALEHFYRASARLLNCAEDEVAFVENATRAFDMAFYSFRFQPGDRILTGISEYGSNVIAYLQQAARTGAELIYVPDDESGQLDTRALEDLIDARVKLIAVSHIPTGGGLVNPATAIGRIARAAGVPYLLDACQTLGQMPLDVATCGCDILCGTGRKFLRGPRGTGLLYMRREWVARLEPPFLDQHAATLLSPTEYRVRGDARRFENWEQFFAGKAALGVAMDYALDWGLEAIQARVYGLAARLRARLADLEEVSLADCGREQCAIVTFHSAQRPAEAIRRDLAREGINVSVADGSGTLVSFQQRGLSALVRASLHYFNTDEEIETFIEALVRVLRKAA